MRDRHIKLNASVQSCCPWPLESTHTEAVPENAPVSSRTWAHVRSGLGMPRSAIIFRCGYDLEALSNGGAIKVWPPWSGLNITTSKLIAAATNGATSDDIGTLKRWGHVKFWIKTTPDPDTWPMTGSHQADYEGYVYPNGINLQYMVADTRVSWHNPNNPDGTTLTNYAGWIGSGAASATAEYNNSPTVLQNTNLVYEASETYNVDWKDSLGAVIQTFNCEIYMICDTDDANFPDWYGAGGGTLTDRMIPSRTVSNARYMSDYLAALWKLYQDHGDELRWNAALSAPPDRGTTYFTSSPTNPICYIDGNDNGAYGLIQYRDPPALVCPLTLGANYIALGLGGYGLIMPQMSGLGQPWWGDWIAYVGYDCRIQKGNYSFETWEWKLDNSYVSGPAAVTQSSETWWRPIICEADGTKKLYRPMAGVTPGIDFERLDLLGQTPRPPPWGEDVAVAALASADLQY